MQRLHSSFGLIACAAAAVFHGTADAQPRVAIVAAASGSTSAGQFTDPQAKLVGTGLFSAVDIINVSDSAQGTLPDLATLQQYDAIMTWSNVNYRDAAALGNLFADYVDAGGGIVVTVFANSSTTPNRSLTGRWVTDGYEIIPSMGGTTSTGGEQSLGAILVPGHPILDGVNTFMGGTSSFRPTNTAVTSHGVRVAEWTDGRTLVAASTMFPGRADLGFYPPSDAVSASWWDSATDGALLMANALLYTIGGDECVADFNGDGSVTVADLLEYLGAYASGDPRADIDGTKGITVGDLLTFLGAYATGCP